MAEKTMEKDNFNDYKEDLKVFEDLFSMSDEELRKEIDIGAELYENRDGKTPEVRELEAFLAEINKKKVLTGIERAKKVEKEKRYNEIISDPEYQARKVKIQNTVPTEKFINEYERYTIFFRVREPLKLAVEIINNSNIDKILEDSEESKKIINAKNQIKFMTDRNNWRKIRLISKEDLIARLNLEETNSKEKAEDTKSQEREESKEDEKNKDEQVKKETAEKVTEIEEAPVTSSVNEEEIKDLVVTKHSIWEKPKGLLKKLSEKNKEIKKKQDKYLKRYVENYKKLNEGQEPNGFKKWVAKHCRYMSKKINEVINYREPINPEDYKGTQAENLTAIVGRNRQASEKLRDKIIYENEQEDKNYENTQVKELVEKVAASKMIGENPWDRTTKKYMEKMVVGQMIDYAEEIRFIDEYYNKRNVAKAVGWEDKEYEYEVPNEPRKVEEVQAAKGSKTRK